MGKRVHHLREVSEEEESESEHLRVHARTPIGWCSVRS